MSAPPVIVSRYKTFLRFFGLVHIAFGIFLFFYPAHWINLVNVLPNQIQLLKPIPDTTPLFWIVTSAAYAWAVGVMFLFAAHNAQHSSWGFAIIFAKLGASIGYGYQFYKGDRYFAFALTPVVDVIFVLIIFGYLIRTSVAQRRVESINSSSDFLTDGAREPSLKTQSYSFDPSSSNRPNAGDSEE